MGACDEDAGDIDVTLCGRSGIAAGDTGTLGKAACPGKEAGSGKRVERRRPVLKQ